ncbi:MAG: hypothetical protein ABSE73_00330 [Planctomycetota bacterium]
MGMTLDENLAEVDRWKRAATKQARKLTSAQRAKSDRETVARIEREFGFTFKREPAPPQQLSPLPQSRPRRGATA